MTVERAFRVAHHLDIPESKRRYWPKFAQVIVAEDGTIPDVFHYFDPPEEHQSATALKLYSPCVGFPVDVGILHTTLSEFAAKVEGCVELARKIRKTRR